MLAILCRTKNVQKLPPGYDESNMCRTCAEKMRMNNSCERP